MRIAIMTERNETTNTTEVIDTAANIGAQPVVRFLLFAGHGYYPHGGTFDLHGKFEYLEDAKTWIEKNHDEVHNSYTDVWADIMDLNTFESVAYCRITDSIKNDDFKIQWFESAKHWEAGI